MGDIVFPGIVMLLKLVSKLFIEREVSIMDTMKALVAFPVDIIFLAFSFGAAILYATPPQDLKSGSIRDMFILVAVCITIAIIVTAFCRKGDKALDQKRFWSMIVFMAVAYLGSIYALLNSFGVREYLK